MTKIHTAKEMAKFILTEPRDFNIDNFYKNEIGLFFERVLEYLQTHASPYQSHFLRQTKCTNPDKIIEAIRKIVPKFNPTILQNVPLEMISKCFTYFLHPDTPEAVRTPCVQLYHNILSSLKTEWIPRMDEANVCIIPFNRYARTHQETVSFEKYITKKYKPIVIYEKPQGTQEDCINNLVKTYQWVNQNWAYGTQENCSFLFKYILSVIYHKIAVDAGYKETNYGFEDPVIEEFHVKTLRFFNDCNETSSELDIKPMFETKMHMAIIIRILEVTKQFNNPDNAIATITFYTNLMNKLDVVDHLLSIDKDLFLTIPFTASEIGEKYILKDYMDQCKTEDQIKEQKKVLEYLLNYLISAYTMLYKKLTDDLYDYLHKYFAAFKAKPRIAAFMFAAFLQRLINNIEKQPEPWNFVMELARDDDVYCAIACKYAQMFAAMQIPTLLEFQYDEAISYCNSFFNTRVQDKIPEKYDYFLKNLEDVIDNPNTLVMEKLTSMWAPLDQYDDAFQGIALPKPKFSDLTDEDMSELSNSFISAFDCYSSEPKTESRRRLFAPLLTYYNTLQLLSVVPPGLQCNVTTVFDYSRKRLFRSILNETDVLILSRTADVIINMVSNPEVVVKLDNESLTCIFTGIIILLLRKDHKLKLKGIEGISAAIRYHIVGATGVLPILVTLLESDEITVSDDLVDVLSSFPLFEVDHTLPKEIITLVEKIVKQNSKLYAGKSSEYIKKPGNDLRKRLIQFLFRKFKSTNGPEASFVWNYILAVVPPLLADELIQAKPDTATFGSIFDALIEACRVESNYAVGIIRSEMMLIPKLAQIAPDQIKQFINNMVTITNNLSPFDIEFSVEFLEVLSLLFIYNYDLMKNEKSYHQYVTNLYKYASPNLKSSASSASFSAPIGASTKRSELGEFCSQMIKMLSIYFGAFPFHNSIQYPTSKAEVPEGQNTISTRTGMILEMATEEKTTSIKTQTPVGRFVWNFEPVTHKYYKQEKTEAATLPTEKTTPKAEFPTQTTLENDLKPLIKAFEDDLGELPLFEFPDEITGEKGKQEEEEYKALLQEFNKSTPDEQTIFRPPVQMDNIKAGIITTFGIFRPSHPHDIKEIPTDQYQIPLHTLDTTNHRILQKFGILYIGRETDVEDYTGILGTQIEETSPLFREFIHELGWPVSTLNHIGYDGELEIGSDRTGETAIYYSDFSREVVFQVTALFKKDLSDQLESLRRRYISNDKIVIIWHESPTQFDPTVVYQPSNILFIVLTPSDTNTIKVEMITKSGFTLHDGRKYSSLYVSKGQLASYIRSTCILAQEQFSRSESSWKHPLSHIISTLLDITSTAHSKMPKDYLAISSIMEAVGPAGGTATGSIIESPSKETYF